MRNLSTVLLAIVLLAACGRQSTDDDVNVGTDFTLTGRVVEVRAGAEPAGIPDLDSDTDVDPQTGGETGSEPGGLIVRLESNDEALDECPAEQNAYKVFYNEDTVFDPLDTTDDDDFPEDLKGRRVDADGRYYSGSSEDDGQARCALVAESITVGKAASTPDPTSTPGPRPKDKASPAASPEATRKEASAEPTATG